MKDRMPLPFVLLMLVSSTALVRATTEGWQTVNVPRLGTLRIPPVMEVLGDTPGYAEAARSVVDGRVMIQQAGLNNLEPAALKQYFRLIISTEDVEPGLVDALSTPIVATEEDLKEAAEVILSQVPPGVRQGFLEEYPASVQRVSAYDAIRSGYKRVGLHGPVVVWTYFIQNYDRIHLITVSYREAEAGKWQTYIPSVLGSLEIADAGQGKADHGSPQLHDREPGFGAELAQAIATGDWRPVASTFILSAILTWGIGLTPPVLVRYMLVRRPLGRTGAIGLCVGLFFANICIFTALGSTSKTHSGLFFVGLVSYYILRKNARRASIRDPGE